MEFLQFGKRPPLMAVVLAASGRALFVAETPVLWKRPPLMAVVLAAGGKTAVAVVRVH